MLCNQIIDVRMPKWTELLPCDCLIRYCDSGQLNRYTYRSCCSTCGFYFSIKATSEKQCFKRDITGTMKTSKHNVETFDKLAPLFDKTL